MVPNDNDDNNNKCKKQIQSHPIVRERIMGGKRFFFFKLFLR